MVTQVTLLSFKKKVNYHIKSVGDQHFTWLLTFVELKVLSWVTFLYFFFILYS